MTGPKVSLCVTNKGRLHHLAQTLPVNLADNVGAFVEFVLLDYSSEDGAGDFVRAVFSSELLSGRIVYYKYEGACHYSSPHAKNLCHKLASGGIVCNVDADNFTGPAFAEYLCRVFDGGRRMLARAVAFGNVFGGRIAVRKEEFLSLGGYDERFGDSWGYDDDDFAIRAQKSGCKLARIPDEFSRSIVHDNVERMRHMKRSAKEIAIAHAEHLKMSTESVSAGQLVANAGVAWGVGRVVKNFAETLEVV